MLAPNLEVTIAKTSDCLCDYMQIRGLCNYVQITSEDQKSLNIVVLARKIYVQDVRISKPRKATKVKEK